MPRKSPSRTEKQHVGKKEDLRERLDEAEETLRAIRNGEVDALIVSGVDGEQIFTLKQAEDALHKSEEQFRLITDNMQDLIVHTDIEGMILYASPSHKTHLGYAPEILVGKSIYDFMHPEDIDRVRKFTLASLQAQTPGKQEFRYRHTDGHYLWLESTGALILDENGSPAGAVFSSRDITERKQAEEAFRESETKYRDLFENSLMGISTATPDGRLLNANLAYAQMYGYKNPDEMMAEVNDIGHQLYADSEDRKEVLRILAEKGSMMPREMEVVRRDGSHITVLVSALEVRGPDGRLLYYQANHIDITKRKWAEEKLAASEAELRTLFAAMTDVVVVYDSDGRYLQIAPTNSINLYRSQADLIGKTVSEVLPKEQAAFILSKIHESIQTSQVVQSEYNLQIDGKEIWFSSKTSRLSENTVIWVAHDITERKRAEEKMKEDLILLHTLIDNLPDRIYVMDVQGRKLISNIADWQASGGKKMEDVIGKTDFDTYPPELAKDYWDLDKAVIDTGVSIINREEPGLDSRGNPAWILTSKVPLRDGRGKTAGLVGIGRDITDRKQREEEIQSRNEELKTLYQLSRLLAEARDLESVFGLVNRHAVESLHITFACLALLEEGELVMRAVYPVRALDHKFIIGDRQPITALPVCQRVLEKNEPVTILDVSPEVGSLERSTLRLDFARSVCLVPLWIGGDPPGLSDALGLLILGEVREEKRESFTPEKIHLARSIGEQASSAIRRLLLGERAGQRLQHLASISEIDRTIVSSFDLRLSLQMVLKHISEQLEVNAADVLILNDRIQTLEFADGLGFRSTAIERTHLRLGEGQAGQAALERRIIQIPDVTTSGVIFAQPELLEGEDIVAYLAVPLLIKGKVKGVLEIFQRTPLTPNAEWLDFLKTLAGQAAIAIDNVQMFENLQRSTDELELAYDATIEGWSHAMDLRDKETEGHALRVTDMTVNLAHTFGLSEAELVQIRWGALLHDIGKMGVPDGILLKPGPLTDEEWVAMKKHPTFAYEMLSPIRYLRLALDIPYCHHEKWDGSGYPRGIKGEQIPLAARIFAVVDVYDALTSDRPYRKAWSKEKALENIKAESGKYFDPQVVKAFLEMKWVADD